MLQQELQQQMNSFLASCPENYVKAEDAIYPELAGMQIYEMPLFGYADAEDSLFTVDFKRPGVIHPDYRTPREWLPEAKTVIAFFLPFTETVRRSNRTVFDAPYEEGITLHCSPQWLHARIEGQMAGDALSQFLVDFLRGKGYTAVCPAISPDFGMVVPGISNWSERHAAYAAGLGTFGLSKGLITAAGMAGRIGSVITDAELPVTKRPYSGPFDYCTMCGACQKRCPAEAIDPSRGVIYGKDQAKCREYVQGEKLPAHGPNQRIRYGCGKCQVAVPCESGIPRKLSS